MGPAIIGKNHLIRSVRHGINQVGSPNPVFIAVDIGEWLHTHQLPGIQTKCRKTRRVALHNIQDVIINGNTTKKARKFPGALTSLPDRIEIPADRIYDMNLELLLIGQIDIIIPVNHQEADTLPDQPAKRIDRNKKIIL